MGTIKSFTSLEQSKKLADILPIESADMTYCAITEGIREKMIIKDWQVNIGLDIAIKENLFSYRYGYMVPCWSLAALRNLLPTAIKPNKDTYLFESHNTFDKSWVYRYYNEDDASYLYCKDINEVDACFEMLIKLKENKLI